MSVCTNEEDIDILERYVSATTAFNTGLIAGAEYTLQELLSKCEDIFKFTGEHHKLHTSILDLLSRINLINKKYKEANIYLNLLLEVDPDSIRAYYRQFQLQFDVFAEEKEALKVYNKVCKVIEARGSAHPDFTLFKAMKPKGENIKRKRSTYLIVEENNIVADNLFESLPVEVISKIMKLLRNKDKINMLIVCKCWRMSILSSPQLISQYTIPGFVTSNKLLSFLRLFDQLSPLKEVILEDLSLQLFNDTRLLRLLLSSQIKCKHLWAVINGSSRLLENVLICEKESEFLANVQYFSIDITTSGCLVLTAELLRLCTSLRRLELVFSYTPKLGMMAKVDKPIILPHVQEIYWEGYEQCRDSDLFIEKLQFENVKKVSIVKNGISLLKKLKRLTNIQLSSFDYISTANMLFGKEEVDMSRVESLTFDRCTRTTRGEIILKDNSIPRLKNLHILSTRINSNDLLEIYSKCRGTLESIELSGDIGLNFGSNNVDLRMDSPNLNFKSIFEGASKLKRVILDVRMTPSKFADIVIDIAKCERVVHLEYFSIKSPLLQTRDLILFVLTIKGKLIVDEIVFPLRNKIELNDFIQQGINEGRFKKCTWV